MVDNNPVLNRSVAATTSTSQLFTGIVLRSNTAGMAWSDVLQGYSQQVAAGKTVQLLTRGTVPVYISSASDAGGVPLPGSIVYVIPTTGLFVTQTVGGTAPVGGVPTNFRVQIVPSGWSANGLVVITNNQNVGA